MQIKSATKLKIIPHREHFALITMTSKLMLFWDQIGAYFENYKKHTNTLCWQNA